MWRNELHFTDLSNPNREEVINKMENPDCDESNSDYSAINDYLDTKNKVFVYGILVGRYNNRQKARLDGYERVVGLSGFYTVIKKPGSYVNGELIEVDDYEFRHIDGIEGNGHFYERSEVEVTVGNTSKKAWVYQQISKIHSFSKEVGFTGTSKGMTLEQKNTISGLLEDVNIVHHGDCIGADADIHSISKQAGIQTVIHPPINPKSRAFCKGDKVLPEKPYLERNQDIVDSVRVLIATPREYDEQLRSGTWSTIRKARKRGIQITIVYPNGSVHSR